jgi:hypothetical protein
MSRQGRDTTKYENRAGLRLNLEFYFRSKPPCPAFWGVAPRTMKIGKELKVYVFRFAPNSELLTPNFIFVLNRHAPPLGAWHRQIWK